MEIIDVNLSENCSWIKEADTKYTVHCGDPNMDSITLQQLYDESRKSNIMVIVYRINEKPTGFIELEDDPEKEILIINYIAVDLEFQNMRIGNELLEIADSIAIRVKAYKITLSSVTLAVRFYKTHDYHSLFSKAHEKGWGRLYPMEKCVCSSSDSEKFKHTEW